MLEMPPNSPSLGLHLADGHKCQGQVFWLLHEPTSSRPFCVRDEDRDRRNWTLDPFFVRTTVRSVVCVDTISFGSATVSDGGHVERPDVASPNGSTSTWGPRRRQVSGKSEITEAAARRSAVTAGRSEALPDTTR
jgi:hypothetical protein